MWRALIICIVVGLIASRADARFDELLVNDRLDNTHSAPIRELLSESENVRSKFTSVHINEPYTSDGLHIYLVPSSKISNDIKDMETASILKRLKNNATAVLPNIVFIDSELIDYLAINANIDTWYRVQASLAGISLLNLRAAIPRDTIIFEAYRSSRMLGAIGDIDRIKITYREGKTELTRSEISNYGKLSTIAASVFKEANDAQFQSLNYVIKASLAPVVFHELGHLTAGNAGEFYQIIQNYFIQRERAKLIKIEDQADEFSAKALAEFMGRQKLSDAQPLRSFQTVYVQQPIIASIKYFRDAALMDLFDGFRSLSYDDLFFELYHKACLTTDGDPSFEKMKNIIYGKWGFLPIMTADERQAMKQKLTSSFANATHSHDLIRSERFYASLGEAMKADLSGLSKTYSEMVQRLATDEADLFPGRFVQNGLGITSGDVHSVFNANSIKKGASCSNCSVGIFEGGSVDVVGEDNVGFIRMIFREPDKDIDLVYAQLKVLLSRVKKLKQMDQKNQRWLEKTIETTLLDTKTCGYGDEMFSAEGFSVKIFRTQKSRALVVTITADDEPDNDYTAGKFTPGRLLSKYGIQLLPNMVLRPTEVTFEDLGVSTKPERGNQREQSKAKKKKS
ncbi:hypothetical protein [Bradyrhizobium sp. 199]|uniref:hypothetical protein n=1 Tax=Bradyrhizobium sp. 199 TaxID=2782664 RepID=UPI001FF909A9|nr:hypothetical protein [Bradyrhizobium sp. 199]MCK1357352.1 hypothetical protein [Bradyrhizobium sp. 199]